MVDEKKVKKAVRMLLEAIGEDPDREGLVETPDRVARMCLELFGGIDLTPDSFLTKQFTAEGDQIVTESDITFYSLCEHHLLPFYGKVHIGYIPSGKVAGLSKLARTVEVYARRPQIQENMTNQIADAIEEHLNPRGVIVVVEAEHMCMTMRGVKKPGTLTTTIVTRGVFKDDIAKQQLFLQMIRG